MTPDAAAQLDVPRQKHSGRRFAESGPAIFAVVALVSLVRQGPLAFEEPAFYANPGGFLEPWNGALALFGRLSFWGAHLAGQPEFTRLIAATVIGLVAVYLSRISLIGALALPVLPIPYPGPYIGPLNSQWWFAIALLVMAQDVPRRWHYTALALAGLSGIGPCLMAPVFRDRRSIALAVPATIQLVVLAASSRRPLELPPDPAYLVLAAAVLASLLVSSVDSWTRLTFAYGSLAMIATALIAAGTVVGQGRYFAVPFATIAVAIASVVESRLVKTRLVAG